MATTQTEKEEPRAYDIVDGIMRFESGEMEDEDEVVEFFQVLIDTGTIYGLQGSYQRAAQSLYEQGLVHD